MEFDIVGDDGEVLMRSNRLTIDDPSRQSLTGEEIEALKSSLDAVQLGVVAELEATDAVKQAGWASTQDYLTHTSGGHKGTGPATAAR